MKEQLYGDKIENIIRKRKSVRTYSNRQIDNDVIDSIKEYISRLAGPFDASVRIELLDKSELAGKKDIKLGTYGVILGASIYAAASVEKNKEHNMQQLGYEFESLILHLTDIGLGTCWLGGTFSKYNFSAAVKLNENEIMPVVSPLGYKSRFRGPIDLIFKPIPNAVKRKQWSELFFNNSSKTPLDINEAGQYATALEMVRLAPSASNRQPWRIIKKEHYFYFYLAHDSAYEKAFSYDIQKIDMGIAMFHFEVAAKEHGLMGQWQNIEQNIANIEQNYEYIISWETIK